MDGKEPDRTAQSGRSGSEPSAAVTTAVQPACRLCRIVSRIFPLALVVSAAIAQPAATPPGTAQPYKSEFKLSTAVGPAYAWGKSGALWAQLVKDRMAGRINIRQFPGASATAGDTTLEFAALRDGTIDLAVGSALNWAARVPALNLFALPFFVGDAAALDTLLRGDVGTALLRQVEAAGVVPLAWGDNGFHALSTATRSIRQPADVAGLRLRTSGRAATDDALKSLGAQSEQMNFAEAQRALQDGTIDGQETTLPVYVATRASTLGQKQILLWNIAAEPLIFAVSRAAWESWSAADRDIVRQAAIEAATKEIELARSAATAAEATVTRDLRGAGVTLSRLDATQRAAFVAATRGVFDNWAPRTGTDLVRQAQDALARPVRP